jgi:membrane protein required for colicin V production
MYRGLTREVLSILSWVAAAVAAFYVIFYQQGFAEELAKQLANPPQQVHLIIARIIIGSAIFLIVLIIVHLITSHISDTVLDSRIGPIDRILGLGFGVVRGFILVVIPYMFAVSFVCKDGATRAIAQGCQPGELPGWIEDARSKNMIKSTGSTLFGVLDRFVPKGISSG